MPMARSSEGGPTSTLTRCRGGQVKREAGGAAGRTGRYQNHREGPHARGRCRPPSTRSADRCPTRPPSHHQVLRSHRVADGVLHGARVRHGRRALRRHMLSPVLRTGSARQVLPNGVGSPVLPQPRHHSPRPQGRTATSRGWHHDD